MSDASKYGPIKVSVSPNLSIYHTPKRCPRCFAKAIKGPYEIYETEVDMVVRKYKCGTILYQEYITFSPECLASWPNWIKDLYVLVKNFLIRTIAPKMRKRLNTHGK